MEYISLCCNAEMEPEDGHCPVCKQNAEPSPVEPDIDAVNTLLGKSAVYAAIIFACGMITGSVATAMYAAELIRSGQ